MSDLSVPQAEPRARFAAHPLPAMRRRVRRIHAPFLPAVVTVAIFLPEALGFFAFGLRLTPARLVLLVLTPVMLFSFGSLLGSERYRFVFSDFFMPATLVWMIVALAKVNGLDDAVKSGGVAGLETIGPYLIMRCLLRTREDVHAIARLLCIIAAVAGPLGLADTVAQYPIVHDQLARLTGYTYYHPGTLRNLMEEYRLGLFRAQGIFEHPILYGVVMCYALMLSVDLGGWTKIWCRCGAGLGLFLSLSSAPWGALVLGVALWLYVRLAPFSHRWAVLDTAAALAIGIFLMAMPNPFGWIINHFTLDPATGYFRELIWQYAGTDIMQSPIVGLGTTENWFRPDWMPSSLDSLWLSMAMKFGIPGSVLNGLAVIGAVSLPVVRTAANRGRIGRRDVRLADALGVITFLTVYLGFTVDYWGVTGMMVGVIAGMRAVLGQLAAP
jgi:hypothetical protein